VENELRDAPQSLDVDVANLVLGALNHAQQVRVISDIPLIRETDIQEAVGEFDLRAFVDSKFVDTSDPVGNTLTTGGANRFIDQNWSQSSGLKKKIRSGGVFEFSERLGYQDNNSLFFVPSQQGTARLTLSFTQPLLKGAGTCYNQSYIVLAQIDTRMAQAEFSKLLQQHLLDLTTAYWDLYLERASLLQKRRLHQQAEQVAAHLEARRDLDVLASQLARARSAVAARRAELVRAELAVKNTEDRIRALVNDPQLSVESLAELVPAEPPTEIRVPIRLSDSLQSALVHRPEIDQAMQEIRASSLRAKVAKKDLLPSLNMVLSTYVYGLNGSSDVGQAWLNQFGEGRPTYSAGLVFDMPLGNNAAKAKDLRRKLELRQAMARLNATAENVFLEVQIAVHQIEAAWREMEGRYQAMTARAKELEYITRQWELQPGENQIASLLLDELLDTQDRIAVEEYAFARAQRDYNVALVGLKRADGTLLAHHAIVPGRTMTPDCASQDCLPTTILQKADMPTPATHSGNGAPFSGDGEQRPTPAPQVEPLPAPAPHSEDIVPLPRALPPAQQRRAAAPRR
jgi:outer membrane protein TolC